jgi:hypothetical protein
MAENVQVVARFRPCNDRERTDNCIEIDTGRDSLSIPDRNTVHEFTFDHVFDGKVTQEEVYEKVAKQAVESVCKGYNATIFAYGASGCLDPETLVLMYNGTTRKAKDVVVGDLLMGDDSSPRTVLKLFSGEDDMYDVIPTKGDRYRVNKSHVLTLRYIKKPFMEWNEKYNRYKVCWFQEGKKRCRTFAVHGVQEREVGTSPHNVAIQNEHVSRPRKGNKLNETKEAAKTDALALFHSLENTGTTIDIAVSKYLETSPSWKRLYNGIRTGVVYPEQEVLIEPYILGLWLGDGSSGTPVITTKDPEILSEINKYAESIGCKVTTRKNNISYRITTGTRWIENKFLLALQKYKLLGNKHIPHDFLVNSRENRLELLAGLLDTDGYLAKKSGVSCACYEIVQKNEVLLDNIITLSRSLGFAAYKKKCSKVCTNAKNGPKSGVYYICNISGKGLEEIPVKIPYKKSPPRKCIKDVLSIGIKLEHVGIGPYNGFLLDGNHRFLLGDFTVTHNSGKSFCMFGNEDGNKKQKGIIPRSCQTIFKNISKDMIETTVKCSFIEIYKERIIDLLNRVNDDLHIRHFEKGVYIQGLTEKYVYSPEDILSTIQDGTMQRTVSSTSVNNVSSRSHALLTITITQIGLDGSEIISKLNLVDLAGSENVGRSEAQGLTLQEAQNINKSLSALGNVINALTEVGRDHIPYRDSKLTYILQDSLGGNSKTIMIATASPSVAVASETLNTMKFAKRAKQIKNAPKVNKNESNINLLNTIAMLNKKIELLEEKLADSSAIGRSTGTVGPSEDSVNEAILFKTRTTRWENRLLCLEKEVTGERQRNKNFLELFEKQRKLTRIVCKELIKERIRMHGIKDELEQYKMAYGKRLPIRHLNEDELEAELDSPN